MHQFDGSVIATALPAMARSLGEDPLRLNLAITCYLLALAVFVPVSGWLSDKFGGKRVFMIAIVIFSISSLFCGLSHTLAELVVWRTLQGVGGAMMTPVGRIIVIKSVPKSELVQAINWITIPALLGPILGPSVGGFIVTYFSWQWIFFINLPIGLLGVCLVKAFIPDLRESDVPRFDLRGFMLVGFAVAALILGFEAMGRGLFPAAAVAVLIATGLGCAVLYIFHARRRESPIVDLGMLRQRTFAVSIWGGALVYVGATSQVFLLALLLTARLRLHALSIGPHDARDRGGLDHDQIDGAAGTALFRHPAAVDLQHAADRCLYLRLRSLPREHALSADPANAVDRGPVALRRIHGDPIAGLCRSAAGADRARDQFFLDVAADLAELRRRPRRAGHAARVQAKARRRETDHQWRA